jgi:hypothetical protein
MTTLIGVLRLRARRRRAVVGIFASARLRPPREPQSSLRGDAAREARWNACPARSAKIGGNNQFFFTLIHFENRRKTRTGQKACEQMSLPKYAGFRFGDQFSYYQFSWLFYKSCFKLLKPIK